MQRHHGVPHRAQHAAHLPVAAFVDAHLHDRAVGGAARQRARVLAGHLLGVQGRHLQHLQGTLLLRALQHPHLGRQRGAVVQHDAVAQGGQLPLRERALHQRQVALHHVPARTQKRVPQFAVGGEQQKSRGVAVQAAQGKQAGIAVQRDQVGDDPVGVVVLHGGHVAQRLVQHEHDVLFQQARRRAVHLHDVVRRIHLRAHFRDGRAVHPHPAGSDERFRPAPAGHPRPRQELLQAH